jgi:hypothetical protein
MFLGELLLALFMAMLFTMIFAIGLRRSGPWANIWIFFLVIFLAAWAGGLWISPAGPVFVGIYWLPVLFFSFIFAVLLAAAVPPERSESKVETISEVKDKEAAVKAYDAFLWILLISLVMMIILGYLSLRAA